MRPTGCCVPWSTTPAELVAIPSRPTLWLKEPRAWEALSGWLPCGAGAGQGPRRLTAVDRWRPLGTAAWGTYRARPARTTWFGPGVATNTGTERDWLPGLAPDTS